MARLTARERVWLPLEYVRTVGPFAGVDRDGVLAALTGLHTADPGHPAVSRLERDRARWVPLDAAAFGGFAAAAVEEVRGAATGPDAMTTRLYREPRGHHPVRILVGGGYIAVKVAHALGDADPVNRLLRALVVGAATGRPAVLAPRTPDRLLTARTLARGYALRPGRWADAIRIVRPPAAQLPHPDDSVPWVPDPHLVTARSAAALGLMRQWRDRYAPGVSATAVLLAAFGNALARVGLAPHPGGAVVLADARRYLRHGYTVDGNFCWGQYIGGVDLADPRSIHAGLRTELAAGRILTMMALREARLGLSPVDAAPPAYPPRVRRYPRPELTLSRQGRHDVLADLPWTADPAARTDHTVPTRTAPETIALTVGELAGTLHLAATFHRSLFDAELVGRALDAVCTDPAALVRRRPGRVDPLAPRRGAVLSAAAR